MYGGATLVGLSRMYNNKHWASDVVLGAAVGTFSGIKVVRYTHGHTDNRIDRSVARSQSHPAVRWTVQSGTGAMIVIVTTGRRIPSRMNGRLYPEVSE